MQKTIDRLVLVIGILASLFHLYIGWFGEPHAIFSRSIHLMFMTVLALLIYPMVQGERKYSIGCDILLMGLMIWAGTYLIVNFVDLAWRQGMPTELEIWLGMICIVIVLEITRRAMGWSLPLLSIFFIVYGIYGPYFGYFSHRPYSLERIASQLYLTTEGIYGLPIGVCASFILLFILFGAFLNMSGAAEFFFDLAYAIAGRRRAGPAQAAVAGSALFGMISGSAVANVSTTGTFTIPLMKKCGFRPVSAGAIEAVASTGGQLMPPIMGAAAFVMAELLEIPYITIAKTAALPAFFYFLSLAAFIEFQADKSGVRKIELENLPRFTVTLRKGVIYLIPIIGLVVFLSRNYSPSKSAVFAIVLILVISLLKKDIREKISITSIGLALKNGAVGTVSTAAACACAGIVVGMINLTGLGLKMSSGIIALAGGSLPLALVLVAVSCLVLGMGMPTTASYIIVAVLGAPALMELGVDALNAHLFVFYYAVISNITPPVALAAFAGAGIAGSKPMKTGFAAVRFGLVAYVMPFLFIYRSEILLMASWTEILWASLCIAAAIFSLGAALVGWINGKIGYLVRVLFAGIAILLFQRAVIGNIIGFALCGIFFMVYGKKNRSEISV